ncbi:MAG: efflux RND transporter periplasmic adaptor subunit [Petrimonas sp.]|nr:efflux RND transporter periplasmic adaptor subunit [Petrimonas sp.]
MKRKFTHISVILSFGIILAGCHSGQSTNPGAPETASPKTPVTIAHPSDTVTLSDDVLLNATATYLLKSDAKANTTGYITSTNIKLADNVRRGQTLFTLQTKEARALGNTINNLDPSFRFSGKTVVSSPATGYVQMLNHQTGDFVQEGDVLATITDASSFGFVMNVPYEYNQLLRNNKNLTVELTDGRNLTGYVDKIMPSVDPVAQTQQVLVKVRNGGNIPENLLATVRLSKNRVTTLAVPKDAILTDESQSAFWVMKMMNDTTAVKTIVDKGIETDKWVQVTSGNLTSSDEVIVSGNYGLSDTAFVKIEKTIQ